MKKIVLKKKRKKLSPRTRIGKARARHLKKYHALDKKVKIRHIIVAFALLLIEAVVLGFIVINEYRERPGILESSSVTAIYRGTDYIKFEWTTTRNTDFYTLLYKKTSDIGGEWQEASFDEEDAIQRYEELVADGQLEASSSDTGTTAEDEQQEQSPEDEVKASATVRGLEEGTSYEFKLRADNDDREGFETPERIFSTRRSQDIEVDERITKLKSSGSFKLEAKSITSKTFSSSTASVAKIDEDSGEVELVGGGTTTITIKAAGNALFVPTTVKLKLNVLDDKPVHSSGANARIIYRLDSSNCKKVIAVKGDGSVHVPQSLAYTGDCYIIAYCNSKYSSPQKIITYSLDGKKLKTVTTTKLGHPNGFTYCDKTKLCYSLRGNSTRVDTYDPSTGKLGTTSMSYGAAGISYDRKLGKIYTTSRTGVRSYSGDGEFTHEDLMGNCKHSVYTYTQDCGAYNGMVFRCMSGPNKHGTNYIDIYRTTDSKYIGSIEVHLGEVESAIVNNDGYLELLVNTSGKTDYIWNTGINVETLTE